MVTLILTGDIMFGRLFNKKLQLLKNKNSDDYKEVYGNILNVLKGVDGVIGNLETTITTSNNKYSKVFNYKLHPQFSQVLVTGNIKYVSLANNHICDYLKRGLRDTQQNLDKLNILYSGVGDTHEEAIKPSIMNIKGIKIAFFSIADHYKYWKSRKRTNKKNSALKNKKKSNKNKNRNPHLDCVWQIDLENASHLEECFEIVKNFRSNNTDINHIVFSCHIGSNKVINIQGKIINFCRKLIDNGVSLVYCHSPHHVLPFEVYKEKYIFYSLGSFIDDYRVDKYRNDLSFLPKMNFKEDKIVLEEIIYTKISDMTLNRTTNQDEINFIEKNIISDDVSSFRFQPEIKYSNKQRSSNLSKKREMNNLEYSKSLTEKFNNLNSFIFDRNRKFLTNLNLVNSLISRCLLPKERKDIFLKVDRLKYMMEEHSSNIKYNDRPSPILSNQTISAPHIHAYAVKHLNDNLKEGATVLDVGCGSGYLTAIFAYSVGVNNDDISKRGTVIGIDIYDDIVDRCKKNIENANNDLFKYPDNLKILNHDGWEGYNLLGKTVEIYDAIHVGARADSLPLPLWKQLKKGGTMVIPLGPKGSTYMQIIKKPEDCSSLGINDTCIMKTDIGVRFVPLTKNKQ